MFGAALATPWTWILLGFRCFATTPHEAFVGSCPAYFALLLGFRRCRFSTMFGTALATPWTWILLGFRCVATTPHEAFLRSCSVYFALLLGVSKVPFGQHVWSRMGHPLDLNPAGVPLFRNHAPRSLFRNLLCVFCFAFRGFEGAVWAAFGAALATPWTWILLGFRCFAPVPLRFLWPSSLLLLLESMIYMCSFQLQDIHALYCYFFSRPPCVNII